MARTRASQRQEPMEVDVLPSIETDVSHPKTPIRKNKRAHGPAAHGPGDEDEEGYNEEVTSHSSKRNRHTNWPLTTDDSILPPVSFEEMEETGLTSTVEQTGPTTAAGRVARFHEGSMNDRPSEKPPSVFTRLSQHNAAGELAVEHLMEDYLASNQSGSSQVPRKSRHGSPRKHPAHRPLSTISNSTVTSDNKSGAGVFRFGREVASNFNPVTIWKNISTTWKQANREIEVEEEEAKRVKLLKERQAKAEEVYAAMKSAGKLGAQGSQQLKMAQKVFSPGYEQPVDPSLSTQRDSGIVLEDGIEERPLPEKVQETPRVNHAPVPTPGQSASRKPNFFFRSPSFGNLKKMRSDVQLATAKSTASLVSAAAEQEHGLRKSQSRKDLQKQHRLNKRVSDLEAKLEQARRDLYDAMGDVPPVPELPKSIAGSPEPLQQPVNLRNVFASGRHQVGTNLPSLPSERLLNVGQLDSCRSVQPPSSVDVLNDVTANVTRSDARSDVRSDVRDHRSIIHGSIDEILEENSHTSSSKKTFRKKRSAPVESRPSLDEDAQLSSNKALQTIELNVTSKTGRFVKKRRSLGRLTSPTGDSTHKYHNDDDTTTVPLAGVPEKPTATATPSIPRATSSTSGSHKLVKPRPIESARSKKENDSVTNQRPVSDQVSPLPKISKGLRRMGNRKIGRSPDEEFEWPDDVF